MTQPSRPGRAPRRIMASLALALATSLSIGASASRAQTASDLTTYTQWDVMHRPTMKIGPDPDGAGSLKRRVEKTTYDAEGQAIQVDVGTATGVSIDGAGAVTATGFVVLQSTQIRYDALGHKTQVYVGAGTAAATLTQINYDLADRPLCTAVRMNPAIFATLWAEGDTPDACTLRTAGTQGPDRITKTVYDAAGQALQILEALGTSDQRTYATYSYSLNGKQAWIEDARFNRTTLRYDGFDRLCRQEFPVTTPGAHASNGPPAPQGAAYVACRASLADAKAGVGASALTGDFEEYGYDASGNRLWQRKRDNGGLSFDYDAINRQTAKTGDNIPGVATVYDLAGKPSSALFSSGTRSGQGVAYAYDTAGRLTGETSFGRTMGSGYDAAGNRTRVTWPDGTYVAYSPDNAGQLKTLVLTTNAAFLTYGYDDLGRRTVASYWTGAANTFGYDEIGRLKTWSLDLSGTAKDQSDTFAYNPAGQVTGRTTTNSAYLWQTTATGLAATADGLNRDQAISTIGGGGGCAATGKGYDCNGNLTNDGARVFSYDGENRLATMSGPAGAALEYDPLGRLAKTTINGTVTQFLYDGDQLSAEYDGAGNLVRRYAHGPGADDPVMWWEGADFAQPRALHGDRQGSIIAWSDGSGVGQATYTYGPYGEPGDNWAAGSRFRYTGQAALPDLKLYHYKARVYDPVRGWFLQTDPIGYKDGLNWYAYVGNDPLNRGDPTGTQLQDIYARQNDERTLEQGLPGGRELNGIPKSTTGNATADWALGQVGSEKYSLTTFSSESRGRLDNALPGPLRGFLDPKCNKFTADALAAGGTPVGRLDGGRIPVAGDWGNSNSNIPGFHTVALGNAAPGDVVSNGHHVGIYAPLANGGPGTVSAATPDAPGGVAAPFGRVLHNNWGFRGNEGTVVIWTPDKK